MAWTEDATARLRDYWADQNLSAREIAGRLTTEIGILFTRNMILGKVHRLGLEPRIQKVRTRIKRPSGAKRLRNVVRIARPSIKPIVQKIVPPKPTGEGVSLLDIMSGQCRYPLTEADPFDEFRYCGEAIEHPGSYCAYHRALCYQPVNERKNERRKALKEMRLSRRFTEAI